MLSRDDPTGLACNAAPEGGVSNSVNHEALLTRARHRGVNAVVYWLSRAVLQPFFHSYFRMRRFGCEHIPTRAR